jgi:hypothetical protein
MLIAVSQQRHPPLGIETLRGKKSRRKQREDRRTAVSL